jgi:fused signal recognition particle receptor
MFDSLKEKLGSFRKEVEEQADVEELDEEGLEETEQTDDEELDEEGLKETEQTDDEELDEEIKEEDDSDTPETETLRKEAVDAEDAEALTEVAETTAEARTTAETVPTDLDDEDEWVDDGETAEQEGETEEPDDANDGTGLARKAKSLVRGRFVIEEEDLEDPLWDLEMALIESDVEMSVAEEILDGIREELVGETRKVTTSTGSVVEDALREALYDVISVGQFDFDARVEKADKPVVIVFTGINGVGKTTTIAKLARYFEEHGLSTVLANGDTYRAGANEQIATHADRLDKKLIAHDQGGDPAAVIYDGVEYAKANDVDVVLGDTAGRLHTDSDLMAQLEKIHRVVDPDMTVFVDEAVAGQDATRRAREFDDAAEIDGAVLTKADADSQGGAAISIAHVTGKPILFLGVGQGYDDLERFDPDWMIDQLLGED